MSDSWSTQIKRNWEDFTNKLEEFPVLRQEWEEFVQDHELEPLIEIINQDDVETLDKALTLLGNDNCAKLLSTSLPASVIAQKKCAFVMLEHAIRRHLNIQLEVLLNIAYEAYNDKIVQIILDSGRVSLDDLPHALLCAAIDRNDYHMLQKMTEFGAKYDQFIMTNQILNAVHRQQWKLVEVMYEAGVDMSPTGRNSQVYRYAKKMKFEDYMRWSNASAVINEILLVES